MTCARNLFFFLDLVQQGMSEKVALVVNFLAAFLTGFVVAYVRSWRLALAMTSILPCIGITGGVMNKAISGYMQSVFLPPPSASSLIILQAFSQARRRQRKLG